MKSFQENLQQLFGSLKEKFSTEMTLWTTAPPVGNLTELSIVDVAEELKVWLMKRKVEESNKGDREEGELSDSDSGNEDSDDDIEVLNANPSPLRTQITSIMKSIELPDYFTKDELIEQLTEIIQRTCRNGNSMEAIQQAIYNGPCFLEETNVEEKTVDMEELEDDFPEVMEIIETVHEMVKKSQTCGKVTDKQIAEEITEANEYAMKLAAERDIDIVDLHKLLLNQMDLLENDLVHWKSEAIHFCMNNIMQHIDENKHKLPEKGWLERAAEKEEVLNGFENASVNEEANALQDDESKDDSQSPCHSVQSEGQGVQGEGHADESAEEQNRNSEQDVEDKSNGYAAENVDAEEMVKKLTLVEQASIETETASGHEIIPEEVSQVLDQILKETTEQPADFLSPLRPGVGDIPKQQQEAEITCESTNKGKDNCLEEKTEDVIVELIEGDQEVKVFEEMVVEEVHIVENPSEKDACSEIMEKMGTLSIDKKGSQAEDSLPYDPDSFDPAKENLDNASSPDLDPASPEPANPQVDPTPLAVNPASPEIDPASPSSLDSLSPDCVAVAPALPDNLVADIDMSGESGYDTPGKTPVGHIPERAIIPPCASESTSSPLLKGTEKTEDQPGKNDEVKRESNEGIAENTKEDAKEKGDPQPVKFFTPQKPVVMKNPLMDKIRYLTPQAKGTKSSVTVNTPEQQVSIPPKRETPTIIIEPPEDEFEDDVISADMNSPVVQNEKNKEDEKEESLTTNRRESLSVPEDNSPIKTEMPESYRNEETANDNGVGKIRSEVKGQDGEKNVDGKSTTNTSDCTKPEVKDEAMCEQELLEGKIGAEKSDDKDCVIL